ncbi:hypothetical protein KEM54_006106 [Ascosphaera aggregata]|nr:hypothetical protein KEM54_006106 [Ascosphaera aggregata]
MPAISLKSRAEHAAAEKVYQLARRSNWAGRNAGVVLVFCIIFIVACGILFLVIYRKMMARKARRMQAMIWVISQLAAIYLRPSHKFVWDVNCEIIRDDLYQVISFICCKGQEERMARGDRLNRLYNPK